MMSNLNEFDLVRISNNDLVNTLAKDINEVLCDKVEAKEVMFWVECSSYADEVTKITYEDVTDSNGVTRRMINFHFTGMGESNITHDLMEWSRLMTELSNKEIRLFDCKEAYQALSEKIIAETDFKELYGKNNADVRKSHVKKMLVDEYSEIKYLEFSIDWIGRRISFLRELVKTKRVLLEVKQ